MINLLEGNIGNFILTCLALTAIVFLRYILLAGLFHFLVKSIPYHKRLGKRKIETIQLRKEIGYSFITSFVFGIFGTFFLFFFQRNETKLYTDIHLYKFYWVFLSILIYLIIHETYYYWLHRLMHDVRIYRYIHKTHHESLTTTAWTSFSFHPLESILQAIPICILLFLVPIYIYSFVFILIFMSLSSIINHLDIEIYPRFFSKFWLTRKLIGATHHHLHHKQFFFNFGLYFTFWDEWMHTESKEYKTLINEKTK